MSIFHVSFAFNTGTIMQIVIFILMFYAIVWSYN